MPSDGIAERVRKLAEPVAEGLSLSIWDIRFVKEGKDFFLRIWIDKPGGVNINDCEAMSLEIDPILDEHDFIKHQYYLEVSSPGLGRLITKEEHFEKMLGREIKIILIRPHESQKEYVGILKGHSRDMVEIEGEKEEKCTFKRGDISKIKLNDDDF